MELEEASKGDEKALAQMWFSLAKEMEKYSKFNELTYETSEEAEEEFRKQIENEEKTNFLITDEGLRKGFMTLKEGVHPSREYRSYTKIVNLYVKKEYRSEGLGTEAIENVKEIAAERGSDHLKVASEIRNSDAIDFYEENGFERKQVSFVQEIDQE